MTNDIDDLLRHFEKGDIESVALLKEGISFRLPAEGSLVCIRLPSIQSGAQEFPVKSSEWFQALWDCVGHAPTNARFEHGKLSFNVGEYHIVIDTQAPDHFDPESALLFMKGELAVL